MKKVFYTLLLMSFFIGANAQTVTIDGNPGYSGNIVVGQSNYHVSESIYTNAEIGTGLFSATGSEITKIAVSVSSNTASALPLTITNFKIYMKSTTAATLATGTYATTGYTTVYSGSVTFSALGWNIITLTTPFKRTAGQNIEVMFERKDNTISSGLVFDAAVGNVTSSAVTSSRRYNSTVTLGATTSLAATVYRPAIQFIRPFAIDATTLGFVNPSVSCYNSTQTIKVAVKNIGTSAIAIGAASVNLTISGANTFSGNTTNTTAIPVDSTRLFSFTGINLNSTGTNDETAIVTVASDGSHANDTAKSSVTTAPILSPLPQFEDVEGNFNVFAYLNGIVGDNAWTVLSFISGTGAFNNGYSYDSLTPRPGGGSDYFLFDSYHSNPGTVSRLYSNCVDLPATGTSRVSFWMSHDSAFATNLDSLYVVVSADKGNTWARVGGFQRPNDALLEYTWLQDSVDVSAYNGQTIQVGFEGVGAYGNAIGLDDINIYNSCPTGSTTSVNSCSAYTWPLNNQTYTTSGTYFNSYLGNCGQNVRDTLILKIQTTGTFASTSISSCVSYTWPLNNQTYTSSGTYIRNYSNSCGAASVDTLKLTIYRSTFNKTTITACNSYNWPANGVTYLSTGIYIYNYTNSSGCASADTLKLTINQSTFNTSTVSSCGPYTWSANGLTYSSSGTYTRAYANGNLCSSVDTLKLTVLPNSNSTTRSTACGSYAWVKNGATYYQSGTYLTSYPSCGTADTLILTIIQQLTPTFTQIAPICQGGTFTLPTTSTNGITGTWSPAINNQTTITYTFAPAAGACVSTTVVTMTVTVKLKTTSTTNQTICSTSLPYVWNGYTITTSGTYLKVISGGNSVGCDSTATLVLSVTQALTPTFNQVLPICQGGSFVLPTTSTNGISGSWSPSINNQATTIYTFTPTAGQCATTTTMTVSVNPTIVPIFNQITAICKGSAFTLPTTSTNGITGIWTPAINNQTTTTYTFTPTAGQCATNVTMTVNVNAGTSTSTNQSACGSYTWSVNGQTYTASGTYINTLSCGRDTLKLTISPKVVPTFTQVAPICKGGSFSLPTTSNNGITGTWAPVINNQATTTYTFTPSTGICATTATMTVTVNQPVVPLFTQIAPINSCQTFDLPNISVNGITGTWSPVINNQATTTYTFTPSTGICATTATMTVTISSVPCGPSTYSSGTLNTPIPPGGTTPTCYPITVSGLSGLGIIDVNYGVASVCINIDHTWVGDLRISLVAPDGTTVLLVQEDGNNSGLNYTGTCFTATATVPISATATAPFTGDYLAAQNLGSVNNGQIGNGVWTLCVLDTYDPSDDGTMINWSMTFSGTPAPPPTLCINTSTTVSSCSSYTWSATAATYTSSGIYLRSYTNTCGTSSVDTLKLTIQQPVTPTFTQISAICVGGSFTLPANSNNGITGSWLPAINNQTTTIYTFAPTAGQCATTATMTVAIKQPTISTTTTSVCANALPYVWNGVSYTSSGSYSKIFTGGNSVGCDSTAILTLTVVNASNTSSTVSSCNSYTWNTVIYTTSGTYTRANNCGTDTLKLTIKRSTTSTSTASVCSNALPYLWNGVSYTSSGSYTKVFTAGNVVGCDSTAYLTLTVVNTSNTSTTASSCNSYTWNTITYTSSGTYTRANTCGTDTLKLTIKKSTTSTTSASVCSNALPYVWNGVSYTSSGSYSKIFTGGNSVGCDSTAILTLTVVNASNTSSTVSSCNSYAWNAVTYTTSGTYTRANNCGTDTLKLTIKRSTTSTSTASVCSNALPYVWNGVSYTSTGTYTKVFVGGNKVGCDSTAHLVLTVVTTSNTSSTVSSCNSYLWNNTTYTTSGTYTRTTSCGTDTLKLTIKKSTSSTSSVAVCSNTLPYLWNGLSYTSSGTYSKLFVGGNKVGCDSTAIVILSIKNTTSSSTTVSVCSNLLPYVWNGVSYTSSGSYSKVIVGGNKVGCDSTAYLTLLVKNTTTSRALVSVCTSALPYVWNGSNYSTSGVYTKVFPLGNAVNCDSTALLDLTVSQSSNLIQSGIIGNKNISKCDTLQTYSVAAIAGVTYNWTVTGTGNYIRSGKGTNVIIAVMKVAGTVSVSATNSCSATASTATFSVIKSTPTTPGTIYQKISPVLVTANTNACLFNQIAFASTGQADTFMIKSVANVKGYLWKVPVGSILNRINDTTIAVVFSNSIVLPDTIKVYAYADCDTSLARALPLTKTLPATPGVMYKSFNANSTTGPAAVTSVCNLVGGGSEIYMIRKIATATSYNWSLKIGTYAVITHLNPLGVNDTAIRVTYNTGFAKDTIVVKSVNGCGISTSRILAVSAIYTPPAVTAIAGSTTPCIGNVITYIASSTVPTATQSSISVYRWTKPNYTTIISASLDSFSITLQYNTGFTGGSIIAKGQSACGVAGTAKTITLQYLPPTPTSITSSTGLYNACIGNVITYTVVVPAPSTTQRAAVAYRWTKPNYTTIVSSSTDSSTITVSFNVGYIGGSLTAKGQTVCGVTGTAKTQALTHSTCPVGTKATPYVITESSNLFDVQLFPNPSTTGFNLKVMSSSKEMTTVKIVDLQGRVVKTFLSNPSNEKLIGQDLKAGFYLIEVSQGVDKKTIRAVKF